MPTQTVIVFAMYPGLTHMDVTGPYEVFSHLSDVKVVAASLAGGVLTADSGLTFAGLERLQDIEACQMICVPGGAGLVEALTDDAYVAEVRRLGRGARYVTSVSSGSLILGAAGFLRKRRATSHWAFRDLLSSFDAVVEPARVVRDGAIITTGGSTAGVDMALTLAAEFADTMTAQAIQLMLEYAPEPPFSAGAPDQAPAAVVRKLQVMHAQHRPFPDPPPTRHGDPEG